MATRSKLLRVLDHVASSFAGAPKTPAYHTADPFAGLLPWELTTRASLEVPHLQEGGLKAASMLMDFAGVCTYRRAITPELIARCRDAAHRLADEMRANAAQHGLDPDADGFQLDGAHQRAPGRHDLRNHRAMFEPPFNDASLDGSASWLPLVHRLLGTDAKLLLKGLVVTEPGTPEQEFHADGPFVSSDEWARHAGGGEDAQAAGAAPTAGPLPAHGLVVFIPLVTYGREHGCGVGPTSFLPGSHTNLMAAALQAEATDSGSSAGAGLPAPVDADAGDAICFDLRTHHAGGGNGSDFRRSVIYYVYARPWYTSEMQRRLLEDAGIVSKSM
jgi:hypothetical protein